MSGTCHCFPGFLGPDCSRGMRVLLFFLKPVSLSHGNKAGPGSHRAGGRGELAPQSRPRCLSLRPAGPCTIDMSCPVPQQPAPCCAAATGSTPRAAACASAAGRAPSATCPPRSASTRSAGAAASASWAPVPATRGTKARTARKVNTSVRAGAPGHPREKKQIKRVTFMVADKSFRLPPYESQFDFHTWGCAVFFSACELIERTNTRGPLCSFSIM